MRPDPIVLRPSPRLVVRARTVGLTGCVALLSAVVAWGGVVPVEAAATTNTTGSCRDGGGITWTTVVKWGGTYRPTGGGAGRVSVGFAGWTTKSAVRATDSHVTTYSQGKVLERLSMTRSKNYAGGKAYDSRNPRDPVSTPGGPTKVTVAVGRDNDGKADCSVTHVQPRTGAVSTNAATRILGAPRSGLGWHSGAWVGGRFNPATINGFGTWRGRPTDMVTTYSPRDSYRSMQTNPWSITTWNGFRGKLNYGVAMLPDDGSGSFASIAAGRQDAVWRAVATNLKKNGRGTSVVRVGWEANLPDWRWHVTTRNAPQFKAAFRRIVKTMKQVSPGLKFDFGIGCGSGLTGSSDRLAPLKLAYPGDDVVDLVGCDTYDWWTTHATSNATWGRVLHPSYGPGIQDVVNFARAHRKGATFPEWGLARNTGGNNGGGDNPYYIQAMFNFFKANSAIVAFECYFDEPDAYIANSLYGAGQNRRAAAMYARLW
jgi:hypothetical protein